MTRSALSILAPLVAASLMLTMLPATSSASPDITQPFLVLPVAEDGAPMSWGMSDDGDIIAAGYRYNGNLTIYSASQRAKLWTAHLSSGNDFQVAVSGDGARVFAIDGSGTVHMFSVNGGATPVWSYGLPTSSLNIVTSTDGNITMVGAVASVLLFDANGYVSKYEAVGETSFMRLAMTSDGSMAVAGCNKYLYVFDSGLTLIDQIWCADRISSLYMGEVGVATSADGRTTVYSYQQPSSVAEMGIFLNNAGYYYYPTFGGGDPIFRLSEDGRTLFLIDAGGLYLIDTISMDVLWNRSVSRTPSSICVSPDGSMMAGSYEAEGLVRIYGRQSPLPVSEISVDHPYRMEFSSDGSTLAVIGSDLTIFRPSAPSVDPHDYTKQFADLRSQISGLELMVMLVAVVAVVTAAVLAVFVLRSRRS